MSAEEYQESGGKTLADLEKALESDPEMQARSKQLLENITAITTRLTAAQTKANRANCVLIAVSKLKPASDILALHAYANQTHFGENYAQELSIKHSILPSTIKWHYIGGLQTNSCPKLAKIPNLYAVHSVDTIKKARQLDKHRDPTHEAINIYIQLNTSREESKSGLTPESEELLELAKVIKGEECTKLKLAGLMTIGALARSKAAETENEDFRILVDEAGRLEKELALEEGALGLSMGMSDDFEVAVGMGATVVRVGSSIFGERPKKEDAVV